MQTGVLRVLRATAASWWRHKELRRTDQTGQAQRRERETVLRDLGYLRQAATVPNAHVICGEGGTFIHLGWTTVSTLAPIEHFPLAAVEVAGGKPSIDIRARHRCHRLRETAEGGARRIGRRCPFGARQVRFTDHLNGHGRRAWREGRQRSAAPSVNLIPKLLTHTRKEARHGPIPHAQI